MPICHVRCLGMVSYQPAWDLQAQLAAKVAAGDLPATLLLLEHPHTFTFGRKGQASNLLWTEAELRQHAVQVFWVDRGGDITYHGPGQLVGYPILRLGSATLTTEALVSPSQPPRVDYTGYLRNLEQVIIDAISCFGVHGQRLRNLTGVWVNGAKLAAIGVKVDALGVTRHGFALNVAPDMSYWGGIVGCGLSDYSITSLSALLPVPPPMDEVIQAIIASFAATFGFECQQVT
jgi:lipoyl(octanoyl) transferase